MKDPLIILIGGAAGTGKTTRGKTLCVEFDITHRLGSGFIREMAKSFIPQEENQFLYNYSFRPHIEITPFENLYKQSEVIKDSIERCISRAFKEGTSLLIEGVNIIPGLISTQYVTLNVVFTVENYDKHLNMIKGKTHCKRQISKKDFEKIREVQEHFKNSAEKGRWPVIDIGLNSDVNIAIKDLLK